MMKTLKRIAQASAASALLFGATVLAAPAASASVSGSVTCVYGNNAEVGVWVSAGSASGWATLTDNGYGSKYYSYPAISAGTSYSLHVGCSGTPQNWGTTFYTPTVSGDGYDWICTTGRGCYQS